MRYTYTPKRICPRSFDIDIEDGKLNNLTIHGGCQGNTKGIELLCKGRSIEELITILDGIQCGNKGTSCPDQISKALKQALNNL